tara:strand:- start:6 stop:368 length:363 start_codon:yes stop_codon:yes gene_type:complete
MNKIYVFYDGKCGICSKEINYYKRLDVKNVFDWVDITTDRKKLEIYNISYNESLMFLHLIDRKGQVQIGVDAFLIIWNEFKYWKTVGLMMRIQPIKSVLKILYKLWAKKRYSKLDYKCNI